MSVPLPDPAALLQLAVTAADQAAALLEHGRPDDLRVAETKSSPTDVVTEMDRAAERLIIGVLTEARPGDACLGEEGGETPGDSGVRWVIDPLDGTVNYLYRLPGWAVSVAAEYDGQVVAGVVTVPSQRERFTAVRGGGAFCNGRPITCNTGVPLARALVATGFGYAAADRARQAEVLAAALPRVRDIRRQGSASVDLCSVACGRVDAYYEQGPHYWDFAAGGLVAAEAGARVEGLHGATPHSGVTVAAAPDLFGLVHELVAGLAPRV